MKAIVIYWQPGVFTSSPVDSGGLSPGPDADSASSTFVEQDEEVDLLGWNPCAEGGRRLRVCLDRYPMGFGRRPLGRVQAPAHASTLDVGPESGDADSESR